MTRLLRAPVATLVRPDLDLVSAWDDLATRTGASPFAHPGWVNAIVDAFGGDLRLVVARSDLEVVGARVQGHGFPDCVRVFSAGRRPDDG